VINAQITTIPIIAMINIPYALLFLVSCLLSYWALRSRGLRRMHRLERIADGIFIMAMIGMVVICALITYTISIPAR